jgi:hypothetical protein
MKTQLIIYDLHSNCTNQRDNDIKVPITF